jgi:hypothetical protein
LENEETPASGRLANSHGDQERAIMTKGNLLVGLLASRLAALLPQNSKAKSLKGNTIVFGPGTYVVGPSGGIRIIGTSQVSSITNCTITPASLPIEVN